MSRLFARVGKTNTVSPRTWTFFFLLLLLLLLRLIHQSVLLRLQRGKSPTVVLLIYFVYKVALGGHFCVGGIKWERANVMKYSLSQEKIKIKIPFKNTQIKILTYIEFLNKFINKI